MHKLLAVLLAMAISGTTPLLAQGVGNGGCPPGLAKKAVPCTPPGHSKSLRPHVGDRLDRYEHILIVDHDRYGLRGPGPYYRVGEYIARVDRETYEILNLVDAVGRVLD